MTDYTIVPMTTEAEMEEKGRVHWQAWHETYCGLMPEAYLDNLTLDRCIAMAKKFPENTLLLKIEGRTVAFSCFSMGETPDDENELVALYLLREFHGRGLGLSLMNAVCALLPKNRRTVLWVLEGNVRAIRFYERYGFRFTGEVKDTPFGKELQMSI